jgi:hypothetical protein
MRIVSDAPHFSIESDAELLLFDPESSSIWTNWFFKTGISGPTPTSSTSLGSRPQTHGW